MIKHLALIVKHQRLTHPCRDIAQMSILGTQRTVVDRTRRSGILLTNTTVEVGNVIFVILTVWQTLYCLYTIIGGIYLPALTVSHQRTILTDKLNAVVTTIGAIALYG